MPHSYFQKLFIFLTVFAVISTIPIKVHAADVSVIQWQSEFSGNAASVVIDSEGNPYVAGNDNNNILVLKKYSGETGELLWTFDRQYNMDIVTKIKRMSGNVPLVAGANHQEYCIDEVCHEYNQSHFEIIDYEHNRFVKVSFNGIDAPAIAVTPDDIVLAAGQAFTENSFEAQPGSRLLQFSLNGKFDQSIVIDNLKVKDIVIANDGNPILTGQTFDIPPQGRTIKYDLNTSIIWDTNTGNDIANGLDRDMSGNPVMSAGAATGVKFISFNATSGAVLWDTAYTSQGTNPHLGGIAVGPDGNYIVTGYTTSPDNGQDEIRTVKIDSATGNKIWDVSPLGDGARSVAVAVGSDGKPVITGQHYVMKLLNNPTIKSLIDEIGQLQAGGQISKLGTSLTDKLEQAQESIDAGNYQDAKDILNALVRQITAQSGKQISQEAAETLVERIQLFIDSLS